MIREKDIRACVNGPLLFPRTGSYREKTSCNNMLKQEPYGASVISGLSKALLD